MGLALGCAQVTPAKEPVPVAATPVLEPARDALHAERISADFSLLDVPVGDLVMQVCPRSDGRGADIDTQMRAATLIRAVRRVGGTAHTTLGADELGPERTEIEVYDGDKTRTYRVSYGPGEYEYEYVKSDEEEPRRGRKTLEVPAIIHDVHSAFLLLRAWKPRLDEHAHFFVVLGRHLYRVDARSAGRKVVIVDGTPRVTTRIDGDARRIGAQGAPDAGSAHRSFSMWFEEGPGAVPVQLTATSSYGEMTMTLTRHERSAAHCEPAESGSTANRP